MDKKLTLRTLSPSSVERVAVERSCAITMVPFEGVRASFFPDTSCPELVGIRSCRRAIQLAIKMDAKKLEIEMDHKVVVGMLNDPKRNLSTVGPLIEEIKTLLKSRKDVDVRWARRFANGVVHTLAKEGCSNEIFKVWFNVPSDCILHTVSSEIPDVFE